MTRMLTGKYFAAGLFCLALWGCSRDGEGSATAADAPGHETLPASRAVKATTEAAAPTPASNSTPRPKGAVVMREHPLSDPGMNNAVASIVLVPQGWTLKGGFTRPSNQLYNMPVVADVIISAPDGRAVHFFPSLNFEFNHRSPGEPMQPTLGGNLYLPLPESPGQWLMQMVRRNPDPTVSQLRLVSEEAVPELTQQLRQQSAQMFQIVEQGNATTSSMGFGQTFDTQATKLVLGYQQHGMVIEETVIVTWQYMVMVQQGQTTSGTWSINMMRSFRGPAGSGYVDDPVLAAIVQSVRVNPAWEAEMQRYWREIARIKQKGANDRMVSWRAHNRKMQQTNSEINDIIVGGYRKRSAIQDQGRQRYIDAIREETPYTTPSGETVKLPSFYDHVYTDGNGTYILNNDTSYNPNRDPTINSVNWGRIEPKR